MTPIVAHFGHWYVELFYLVPFVVIVTALKWHGWRERRRTRRDPPRPDGDGADA